MYRLPAGCGKSGLYSVASSEDYLLAGDDAGGVGIWNLRTAHSRYVKTESNMQILTVLVMDASRAVFAPNENYLLVYNYVTGTALSHGLPSMSLSTTKHFCVRMDAF